MATSNDPLLQDLCKICHTNPPKYKCPRCYTATCSLVCVRRHKQWDECSGVRDPAEYVRRKDLATPAAFDKDYNFLSGVERLFERSERLREQRGLPEIGHDGEFHQRGRKGFTKGKAEELLQERFKEVGVNVVKAPLGLTRNKQNQTHWHKKFGCINWTIEWVLADGTQLISRCYETTPIMTAYLNLENRRSKRKREGQDLPEDRQAQVVKTSSDDSKPSDTVNNAGSGVANEADSIRNSAEGDDPKDKPPLPLLDEIKPSATVISTSVNEQSLPNQSDTTPSAEYFLYLHRPQTISKIPVLIPLPSTQTLRESLQNRTVLEFPTIFVLRLSPEEVHENGDYVLEKDYVEGVRDAEKIEPPRSAS